MSSTCSFRNVKYAAFCHFRVTTKQKYARRISFFHAMNDLPKIARRLFSLSCFMGLGYMTVNQVARYIKNDDTSITSFKKLTSDNYPTYTLCFEDNDKSKEFHRSIFRTTKMCNDENITAYFAGRWLRYETSPRIQQDWIGKWHPNIPLMELKSLFGIPGSMYIPIPCTGSMIIFNETFLIPPDIYKNVLKGMTETVLKGMTETPPKI